MALWQILYQSLKWSASNAYEFKIQLDIRVSGSSFEGREYLNSTKSLRIIKIQYYIMKKTTKKSYRTSTLNEINNLLLDILDNQPRAKAF